MQDQKIDTTMPGRKWEFDPDVTACFDNMLERSIPQYTIMRKACFDLAKKFAKDRTAIVDMGCSRGEAIAPLVDMFGVRNKFIGIECSRPMADAAKERFAGYINVGVVDIRESDLRGDFPEVEASVVLSVLTLQFTPIEYRQQIIQRVFDHIIPGGAFILVEKILGGSSALDSIMVEIYYDLKRDNGYSQDQIERKRLSLEGVLVPVTARWNEDMLRTAGFRSVDCFWRWMNFAGWIAIK